MVEKIFFTGSFFLVVALDYSMENHAYYWMASFEKQFRNSEFEKASVSCLSLLALVSSCLLQINEIL